MNYLAGFLQIGLSKDQYYDRLIEKVIKKICTPQSVCIDVGAQDGKILALIIKHCPKVIHYAFEPLPHLYKLLVRKYGSAAKIFQLAVSNQKGIAVFNDADTQVATHGLFKQSNADKPINETTRVATDLLDNVLPADEKISLIKLDLAGGELNALLGASNLINQYHPAILLKFLKGDAEIYGENVAAIFRFLTDKGYSIYLFKNYIKEQPALKLKDFNRHYSIGDEYFFVVVFCK